MPLSRAVKWYISENRDLTPVFFLPNIDNRECLMGQQNRSYPQETSDGVVLHRNYCLILNPQKYNRNLGCKFHDNAYGVKGGGGCKERKAADLQLLSHMRREDDPLAWLVYLTVRFLGWFFFNYHKGWLWRGQLSKRVRFVQSNRK
jgi:hypothetical protein